MNRRGIITLIVILAAVGTVWLCNHEPPVWEVVRDAESLSYPLRTWKAVLDDESGALFTIEPGVAEQYRQTVSRIEPGSMRTVCRYRVNYEVDDLRYYSAEDVLYLVSSEAKLLIALDGESGRPLKQVKFAQYPTCVEISPDGGWLYVATGRWTCKRMVDGYKYTPYKPEPGKLIKLDRATLKKLDSAPTWSGAVSLGVEPESGLLVLGSGVEIQQHAPPIHDDVYVCCDYDDIWYKHQVFDGESLEVVSEFEAGCRYLSSPVDGRVLASGSGRYGRPPKVVEIETGETTEIPIDRDRYWLTEGCAIAGGLNQAYLLVEDVSFKTADILVVDLDDMSAEIHKTGLTQDWVDQLTDIVLDEKHGKMFVYGSVGYCELHEIDPLPRMNDLLNRDSAD